MTHRVTRIVDAELLEVTKNHAEEPGSRGVVPGYWRSDGQGSTEQLEPEFFLGSTETVQVETSTQGSVDATLYFYSRTTGETRPPIPQEGGSDELGPGAWTLSISGSISLTTESSIEIGVHTGDGSEVAAEESLDDEGEVESVAGPEGYPGYKFTVRMKGYNRARAVHNAHTRAKNKSGHKPYRVLEERVYPEQNYFVCFLSCEVI
ncbi:MAG: hypothetical protein AAGD01_19390 [Acidobacteriota bacterium]